MSPYPKTLLSIIQQLKKLPGVGRKSAERFAFKMLEWSKEDLMLFSDTIKMLSSSLSYCVTCGCLQEQQQCPFCSKSYRAPILCITASAKDVYAIEHTQLYKGHYHVLGCLLSPLQGKTSKDLKLDLILERIKTLEIQEVILALDSTLEGDATALYLFEHFEKQGLKITKLASGVPMGTSLDFIDENTLSHALTGRHPFHY